MVDLKKQKLFLPVKYNNKFSNVCKSYDLILLTIC